MDKILLTNKEYIQEFIKKHGYHSTITVQCYKSLNYDAIKTIVFDERDIPSKMKIDMEDIKYDVDSSLPNDVFYKWLEYRNTNENSNVSFIYWMTKMDNKYFPDVDISDSLKMKEDVYKSINSLKSKRWF